MKATDSGLSFTATMERHPLPPNGTRAWFENDTGQHSLTSSRSGDSSTGSQLHQTPPCPVASVFVLDAFDQPLSPPALKYIHISADVYFEEVTKIPAPTSLLHFRGSARLELMALDDGASRDDVNRAVGIYRGTEYSGCALRVRGMLFGAADGVPVGNVASVAIVTSTAELCASWIAIIWSRLMPSQLAMSEMIDAPERLFYRDRKELNDIECTFLPFDTFYGDHRVRNFLRRSGDAEPETLSFQQESLRWFQEINEATVRHGLCKVWSDIYVPATPARQYPPWGNGNQRGEYSFACQFPHIAMLAPVQVGLLACEMGRVIANYPVFGGTHVRLFRVAYRLCQIMLWIFTPSGSTGSYIEADELRKTLFSALDAARSVLILLERHAVRRDAAVDLDISNVELLKKRVSYLEGLVTDEFEEGVCCVPRNTVDVVSEGIPQLERLVLGVLSSVGGASLPASGEKTGAISASCLRSWQSRAGIAVMGAGGVGKSTAMLHTAHVPKVREAFQGIYWMGFGPETSCRDVIAMLQSLVKRTGGAFLARCIGIIADGCSTEAHKFYEVLKIARSWFFDRRAMFMFDDVWPRPYFDVGQDGKEWTDMLSDALCGHSNTFVFSSRFEHLGNKQPVQTITFGRIEDAAARTLILAHAQPDTDDLQFAFLNNFESRSSEAALVPMLNACDGHALALAMCGNLVRRAGYRWSEVSGYFSRASAGHSLGRSSRKYSAAAAVFNATLSFLSTTDFRNETLRLLGNDPRTKTFVEQADYRSMYLALAALGKIRSCPLGLLSAVFGVEADEAELTARCFASVGLAKLRVVAQEETRMFDFPGVIDTRSCFVESTSSSIVFEIHDLHHAFAEELCIDSGSSAANQQERFLAGVARKFGARVLDRCIDASVLSSKREGGLDWMGILTRNLVKHTIARPSLPHVINEDALKGVAVNLQATPRLRNSASCYGRYTASKDTRQVIHRVFDAKRKRKERVQLNKSDPLSAKEKRAKDAIRKRVKRAREKEIRQAALLPSQGSRPPLPERSLTRRGADAQLAPRRRNTATEMSGCQELSTSNRDRLLSLSAHWAAHSTAPVFAAASSVTAAVSPTVVVCDSEEDYESPRVTRAREKERRAASLFSPRSCPPVAETSLSGMSPTAQFASPGCIAAIDVPGCQDMSTSNRDIRVPLSAHSPQAAFPVPPELAAGSSAAATASPMAVVSDVEEDHESMGSVLNRAHLDSMNGAEFRQEGDLLDVFGSSSEVGFNLPGEMVPNLLETPSHLPDISEYFCDQDGSTAPHLTFATLHHYAQHK